MRSKIEGSDQWHAAPLRKTLVIDTSIRLCDQNDGERREITQCDETTFRKVLPTHNVATEASL